MKRYEQGSIGMRPDPEGAWCDYNEIKGEIERLQRERDEARGIATRSTLRSEKLRVIARQLYREIEGDDQHFDAWLANKLREALSK